MALVHGPVAAQTLKADLTTQSNRALDLKIDQKLIQSSPVLRRWLAQPPDVLQEIDQTPAFPTRLQLTLFTIPSRGGDTEWSAAFQDIFLAQSSVSVSTEYSQSTRTENRQWGTQARVYLLPLGSHLNIAPVMGYRTLIVDGWSFQGPEIGTRFVIASPQAADISFTQSFTLDEVTTVGRSQLAMGYALSPSIRISAQVQWQNSPIRWDTAYGFSLELVQN